MRLDLDLSPRTANRVARLVITSGGLLLIVAVLTILVFIAREAAPLLGSASVTPSPARVPAAAMAALAGGVDDERHIGFEVGPRATAFFRTADGETLMTRPH